MKTQSHIKNSQLAGGGNSVTKFVNSKSLTTFVVTFILDRRVRSLNQWAFFMPTKHRVSIPPCDVLMHSLPVKVKVKGSDRSPYCVYQVTTEPQSI